jgi:hypothetical protein
MRVRPNSAPSFTQLQQLRGRPLVGLATLCAAKAADEIVDAGCFNATQAGEVDAGGRPTKRAPDLEPRIMRRALLFSGAAVEGLIKMDAECERAFRQQQFRPF